MPSTQPLLKVNELSVNFRTEAGPFAAVKAIGFDVQPGEVVAIVGESGSGKSVTALSLLGLLPSGAMPMQGQALLTLPGLPAINLLQASQKDLSAIRGSKIGMIFQEPMSSLNPVISCGEQVTEVLIRHKGLSRSEAYAQVIALFEEVELPRPAQLVKAYPHELSGGQKQRVMIAMAIACNPSLLIADEPTTALDVTVQARILALLQKLSRERKMAMLFITHDLGVVASVADRVLVMYQGKIVEQGITKEIFQNPLHVYTQALLACRPTFSTPKQPLLTLQDFTSPSATKTATGHLSNNVLDAPTAELLTVKNLKVYFETREGVFNRSETVIKAVDDVSFVIKKGETMGLVGESGCGKTTLGRALVRLVKPTAGNILLNNVDLASLSSTSLRKRRKDFQLIFQDPYASLNPRRTIGQALVEPLQVHQLLAGSKQRKEKAVFLLEKVGLSAAHFNRYPHEFSGGQRQRISIARALTLETSFLICDESVSALDVSVQAQVLNLINQLKKEFSLTILFITHNLAVAKYMSDTLLVMHKGKIVEYGRANDVFENPQSEYTRTLINSNL